MKKFLPFFLSVTISFNLNAQIDSYFNEFISDTVFRHAGISICLRDGESGEIIAGYNQNMALGSASLMKLVTTSTALELLGPGFLFTTHVGYVGDLNRSDSILNGHIIIRGGADPTLLSEYFPDHNPDLFEMWKMALLECGIRKVEGSIVSDAKIFDYHPAVSGWAWADIGNYYGAGPHGLTVRDNMYRIHFKTGIEGSKPELLSMEPEIHGLLVDNLLTSYGTTDNGYVYLEPYGKYAIIRGQIPAGREDFILKAAMPDPPLFLAETFSEYLTDAGFIISGKPTTLRLSASLATEFQNTPKSLCITSYSPPLKDIIGVTNCESVNLFAEHMIKYLGYAGTKLEGASKTSGIKVVETFLESILPGYSGLYMTDGSGLSRSNAMSTSFITSLLHYMKENTGYSDIFFNSLAKAGEEGTLEYYFRDPVFRDNLRAKSGTSTRIRNYAGYFTCSSGKQVVFAVMTNNFDCSPSDVTGKVESLLAAIINRY